MVVTINPLNAKLNPICHLLALLGAHPILHISRIRVKSNAHWVPTSCKRTDFAVVSDELAVVSEELAAPS